MMIKSADNEVSGLVKRRHWMSIFTFAAVDTASIHVVVTGLPSILTFSFLTLWHSSLKLTFILNKKYSQDYGNIEDETSRDTTEQHWQHFS